MAKVAFILTVLAFILGGNFYVFYRINQLIPSSVLRVGVMLLGVIIVSSFFMTFLLHNVLPPTVSSFLYKLGTSWFVIMIYLLILFLIADLLKFTPIPVARFMHHNWLVLGLLTFIFTTVFLIGYIRYYDKERVEVYLHLADEQKLDKPLKIVALSDLHLGYSIDNKEFNKWVELINHEKPDIVLLIGDIIDNYLSPVIKQQMDITFHKIESKYGVFAVVGNHEYISGINESKQFLKQCGITLLSDSMILIDSAFYLVGRDDRFNPDRKTIETLCHNADPSKPIILMDHQPYHLEEAAQQNIFLQLSGHTHDGQFWPVSWITKWMYEKSHGYLKKDNTHYFITSGIGIWGGKFRIGTRSEYVVITIQ